MNILFDVLVDTHNEKKKGDTKDHPQVQWFLKHSDLDELARLKAARQQVGGSLSCFHFWNSDIIYFIIDIDCG